MNIDEKIRIWKSDLELEFLIAVGNNNYQAVEDCIKAGVNVNVCNKRKADPALKIAVDNGCLAIVKLLLESGAEVNVRNAEEHSVFLSAIFSARLSIAKALLSSSVKDIVNYPRSIFRELLKIKNSSADKADILRFCWEQNKDERVRSKLLSGWTLDQYWYIKSLNLDMPKAEKSPGRSNSAGL